MPTSTGPIPQHAQRGGGMAGKPKLAADDLGDTLQRPPRSGKARGFGASHEDPHQLLLLVGVQARFAAGPACRAQNIVPEVEMLLQNAAQREKIKQDYALVRRALGSELKQGATQRTAEILEALINL